MAPKTRRRSPFRAYLRARTRTNERLRSLIAVVLWVSATPALAQSGDDDKQASDGSKPKVDVKIEGRVSVGTESMEFKNGRSYYDAEIDFETKRKEGTRAVASFRAKSKDTAVVVEDAYIDHKLDDGEFIHAGQTKKILGLEYHQSDRDRLTITRSPMYRKLEEFAYVGREMTIRWEQEPDLKAGERGYQASIGYSESIDANVIGHVEQPFADGDLSVGAWIMLQSDRIDAGRQLVYATIMSLWSNRSDHRFQLEAMAGKDPYMSEYSRAFGDGKPVHFAGVKAQYGLGIKTAAANLLEPLLQTSVTTHDLNTPGYNTIQILLGLNFWTSEALRLSFNVEGIGTNSTLDLKTRAYNDSNARLEATYYF